MSQKIAPLSESVGFKTVVIDDRADFANREKFPEPIEIRVIDSFRQLPQLEINEDSYLVIVTRGHLYDKHVLEQVLRSPAAYIGMIGSRNKRELIYKEMIDHGFTQKNWRAFFARMEPILGQKRRRNWRSALSASW